MPQKTISIDDLLALKCITSLRCSPDGRHAVVGVRTADLEQGRNVSTLWLYRREDDSFEQVTHGPADTEARWLDETTFLFVGAKREKEKEDAEKPYVRTRIYTMSVRGGEPTLRATLDGRVWDMDVCRAEPRIALSYTPHPPADDERRQRWAKTPPPLVAGYKRWKLDAVGNLPERCAAVYLLEAGKDEWPEPAELVASPTHWHTGVRWAGADRILFLRRDVNQKHMTVDLGLVDLDGHVEMLASPVRVITSAMPNPEGTAVVLTGNDDPERSSYLPTSLHVRSTDPADESSRLLASTDGKMGHQSVLSDVVSTGSGEFSWEDSEHVIGLHSIGGRTELLRVDVSDGRREVLAGDEGVVQCFDCAAGTTLYAWGDYTNPVELLRLGRKRPVERLNGRIARRFDVEPDRWLTTPETDVEVDTFLWATPEQLKSRRKHAFPLVVYVHGGPALQTGEAPFFEYAWLAHEGFAVVTCNPRGSTGYGADHGTAIHGGWGERDADDVLAVREETLHRYPQFDPERTFIVGGSYGGFMANWMITQHPGVFRAAVSQRSISNHVSFAGTGDMPMHFLVGGTGIQHVWENPDRAWAMSPLAKLPDVTEPILLIHSEADLRCPLGQGEEMFAGLVELGKRINEDVRFVVFRGESHGLSRGGKPDNRRRRLDEIIAWLRKHDNRRKHHR